MDTLICINCDKKGHGIRNCQNPITSYGIIAVKKFNNDKDNAQFEINESLRNIVDSNKIYVPPMKKLNNVKILMIQRKDTIGFTDFIRGRYKTNDDDLLKVYFTEMTREEQDRILNVPFDEMWENLWVNHKCRTFKNERDNARKKFLDTNTRELVSLYPAKYTFQEFGFPKGRKNGKETDIQCAQREFSEETQYTSDDYTILDLDAVIEEFTGTDGIRYKHVYFIVLMNDSCKPPIVDKNNKVQSGEVGNIGWLLLDECLNIIRPYDIEKKNIVKNLASILYGI